MEMKTVEWSIKGLSILSIITGSMLVLFGIIFLIIPAAGVYDIINGIVDVPTIFSSLVIAAFFLASGSLIIISSIYLKKGYNWARITFTFLFAFQMMWDAYQFVNEMVIWHLINLVVSVYFVYIFWFDRNINAYFKN